MGGHAYFIELTMGGQERYRSTIYVMGGPSSHDVKNKSHFLDYG